MLETSEILSNEIYVESAFMLSAKEFVFDHFNSRSDQKGVLFHNLKSTTELVKTLRRLSEGNKLAAESQETLILAGWFTMTGHIKAYHTAEQASIDTFKEFAASEKLSKDVITKVTQHIQRYFQPNTKAEGLEAQVFVDAITIFLHGEDYKARQGLLEYERELCLDQPMDSTSLQKIKLDGLLNANLQTPYALEHYARVIDQNRLWAKKQQAKSNSANSDGADRPLYEGLEDGVPNRGIQSYFRSIYRVHINLSAIADNKANIMISVNAILISVLISLLSYQNITETNPKILFPVLAFIVTGLTSLIFAVLSARPKVTYSNKDVVDRNIKKRNMIFFGNYVNMQLDEYEDLMDEVFRDGKLIYGNMIRDMYFLGKVLDKKYQFLSISYNIFMIGFAVTVISFLVLLFVPNI